MARFQHGKGRPSLATVALGCEQCALRTQAWHNASKCTSGPIGKMQGAVHTTQTQPQTRWR